MRSIYVPLPEDVADRLRELARRELRDPREQAVWLTVEGLRRADLEAKPDVERKSLAAARASR